MGKSNLPDRPERYYHNRVNLPFYREELTSILNDCFVQDVLEMDEFEDRLVKVQQARSLGELEILVDDLPTQFKRQYYNAEPASGPASDQVSPAKGEKLKVVLGEKIFRGISLENNRTKVVIVMGEGILDLRNTTLPNNRTEINITCVMGEVKVIIPKNAILYTKFSTIMSGHKEGKGVNFSTTPDSPKITLTGNVVMGEIKIKAG